MNTLPDNVCIFVKERKPKTSAEAGRLADDYIIARKENVAGVEKEEEKVVCCPVVGSAENWVMWRVSVGRRNPDLSKKQREQRCQGARERTSKILSVTIATRRDITPLIVQAMLCSAGKRHQER